jgi:hypothetical protein
MSSDAANLILLIVVVRAAAWGFISPPPDPSPPEWGTAGAAGPGSGGDMPAGAGVVPGPVARATADSLGAAIPAVAMVVPVREPRGSWCEYVSDQDPSGLHATTLRKQAKVPKDEVPVGAGRDPISGAPSLADLACRGGLREGAVVQRLLTDRRLHAPIS